MWLLQALQVLETLIIPETDKLDLRDKQAVSDCHGCCVSLSSAVETFARGMLQCTAMQYADLLQFVFG